LVWIIAILFILFLISGAALAYVVGAAAVLSFVASDNVRYLAVLPQRIFSALDVFALMAMVLFILTGEVMNRTGVTRYLIDFSMSMVGRFKGGLGHVNILTSIFFAGVSGSAVADAAALSNTLVPARLHRRSSVRSSRRLLFLFFTAPGCRFPSAGCLPPGFCRVCSWGWPY
jgi:TRAP-type uncharacterized transport system fused permease subunit